MTWYHTPPAPTATVLDPGRLRDLQFAIQGDVRLGTPAANVGTLSAGYRLLELEENLRAFRIDSRRDLLPFLKGGVHVVQVKWNVPTNGAVHTPIAIAYRSTGRAPRFAGTSG